MSRQIKFDWRAELQPRRLAWATLEIMLYASVFLLVASHAGKRLADMWWIFPLTLMPYMMLSRRLGERLGVFERSTPARRSRR